MKREVETLRTSLAQAQAELSLGSRDQLNHELSTCRAALEAANADNERARAMHKVRPSAASITSLRSTKHARCRPVSMLLLRKRRLLGTKLLQLAQRSPGYSTSLLRPSETWQMLRQR